MANVFRNSDDNGNNATEITVSARLPDSLIHDDHAALLPGEFQMPRYNFFLFFFTALYYFSNSRSFHLDNSRAELFF